MATMHENFGHLRALLQSEKIVVEDLLSLLEQAYNQAPEQYQEVWLTYLMSYNLPQLTIPDMSVWNQHLAYLPSNLPLSLKPDALESLLAGTCKTNINVHELSVDLDRMTPDMLGLLLNARHCENLVSLFMTTSITNISDEHMLVLADASCLSSIRTLHITNSKLTSSQLHILCQSQHLQKIVDLNLTHNAIDHHGLAYLIQHKAFESLEHLVADHNELGADGLVLLAESSWCTSLRTLVLHYNGKLDQRAADALFLANWTQLEHLSMSRFVLSQRAGQCFQRSKLPHTLSYLSLNYVEVNPDTIAIMLEHHPWSSLKTLCLNNLSINVNSIELLARKRLPALTHLELQDNKLTTASLAPLAHAPWVKQLHTLNLEFNVMGEGAGALLASLSMPQLRKVHLGCCSMGQLNSEDLAQASWLETLEYFDYYDNNMGDNALISMLEGRAFHDLKSLSLYCNELTDLSIQLLVKTPLPRLNSLDVSANEISDVGAHLIYESTTIEQECEVDSSENECDIWYFRVGNESIYEDAME